jgi:hypothetical protein
MADSLTGGTVRDIVLSQQEKQERDYDANEESDRGGRPWTVGRL